MQLIFNLYYLEDFCKHAFQFASINIMINIGFPYFLRENKGKAAILRLFIMVAMLNQARGIKVARNIAR